MQPIDFFKCFDKYRYACLACLGLICLLMALSSPAYGQDDPSEANPPLSSMSSAVVGADGQASGGLDSLPEGDEDFMPNVGQGMVVVELFQKSPVINSLILVLSLLALGLFAFFYLTLKAHTMAPPMFIDQINKLVRDKSFGQAVEYCRNNENIFVASIVQRSIENKDKPTAALMNMIDSEGARRADLLWNHISYLSDIANIAPMLGLLGTVVGMIQAFYWGLTQESASINSALLSNAIGGAMTTTMFGLSVGILAVVFYSLIKAKLTHALGQTQRVVNALADHMKQGQD